MRKALIILQKEWLELRQERSLVAGTLLPPVLLTILPLVVISVLGRVPDEDTAQLGAVRADPALAGLSLAEMGQALLGKQFALMFLLMPLVIPSVIASYSIVGEKTRRTLEPLLAAPVATWELLLGKSLTALLPALIVTWASALVFVALVPLVALSERVVSAIVGPTWWLMLLLCTPSLSLIMIAASVAVSERVSDPRTAQQLSAVVVVPLMGLFFAQLTGLLVLSPLLVVGAALVLALIAALAMAAAVLLFRREHILTRWG